MVNTTFSGHYRYHDVLRLFSSARRFQLIIANDYVFVDADMCRFSRSQSFSATITPREFVTSVLKGRICRRQIRPFNTEVTMPPASTRPPAVYIFDSCLMRERCSVARSQNAVSAYFTSKQILPFGFAGIRLGGSCPSRSCSSIT